MIVRAVIIRLGSRIEDWKAGRFPVPDAANLVYRPGLSGATAAQYPYRLVSATKMAHTNEEGRAVAVEVVHRQRMAVCYDRPGSMNMAKQARLK